MEERALEQWREMLEIVVAAFLKMTEGLEHPEDSQYGWG